MKKISDADLEKVNGGNSICGGAVCDNGNITGEPVGTEHAGGICGGVSNESTINNCYNTGSIDENAKHSGGFVGKV